MLRVQDDHIKMRGQDGTIILVKFKLAAYVRLHIASVFMSIALALKLVMGQNPLPLNRASVTKKRWEN